MLGSTECVNQAIIFDHVFGQHCSHFDPSVLNQPVNLNCSIFILFCFFFFISIKYQLILTNVIYSQQCVHRYQQQTIHLVYDCYLNPFGVYTTELLLLLDLLEKVPVFCFCRKNWKTVSFFIVRCWKTGSSGFLSICLSLMCPRKDIKRPVGSAYDSVQLVVWNMH